MGETWQKGNMATGSSGVAKDPKNSQGDGLGNVTASGIAFLCA